VATGDVTLKGTGLVTATPHTGKITTYKNDVRSVTFPSPVRPRLEFYTDPEADAIIEWASAQPALRWQVGRVLLLTLR
jgi:hypothetical protein